MIRSEGSRSTFLDNDGKTLQMTTLFGASSDTKPIEGICNGSCFVEVDTGEIFLWDEEQNDWIEQFSIKGGGSNYTELLNGTVANIFTNMTQARRAELATALGAGNASALITVDAQAMGFGTITEYIVADSWFNASAASINSESSTANNIAWDVSTGIAERSFLEIDGTITDVMEYAEYLPATLTIYWHPMN